MDLRLVFLGTAGAVPTVNRAPSGLLVIRGGERLLFDCGEGTQRQLMRSVGLARIDRVFITHLHGDHFLGLPGLLKTLGLLGREQPLELYGPPGLDEILQASYRMFGRFPYPLEVHEVGDGLVVDTGAYQITATRTDHGIPSLAWCLHERPRPGRFHPEQAIALGVQAGPDFRHLQLGESLVLPSGAVVEPEQVMDEARSGRKIVVTGDTRPTESVVTLSYRATVLVHDATFTESERLRAMETRHSTSREAAEVATRAEARLLVLTHVSSRHGRRELLGEARAVFRQTLLPSDLDHLVVPYAEKGEPELITAGAGEDGCYENWPEIAKPVY